MDRYHFPEGCSHMDLYESCINDKCVFTKYGATGPQHSNRASSPELLCSVTNKMVTAMLVELQGLWMSKSN